MELVDSHCHLDGPKFDGDRDAAVERARTAGVRRFLAIGTGEGPPDLEAATRLADRYEGFLATVGVHPHDAAKAGPDTFERLRELMRHPKVVAIGEIGLDYHYDFAPRHIQRRVFEEQLAIAADAELPVVIHTREAWADTVSVLRDRFADRIGVFHCFTGTPAEAEEALELDFYLGFGGVITFPKSDSVRDSARIAPRDRILLETDAPYLAPAPYRGKRNEPAFVLETARKLAEVRGVPIAEIASATTHNFARFIDARRYTGTDR